MKILETSRIKAADQYTIEHEPITSADLMERASRAVYDAIRLKLKKQDIIRVFCGMGNNGGDGLALSRMLVVSGYTVYTYKIIHAEKASVDFELNEKRLKKLQRANYLEVQPGDSLPAVEASDIIIDAMFGSGLSRPLEGFAASVVRHINASGARVISIDLPSGLFGEDNSGNIADNIIKADYTYTFQFPKLSFMFPENEMYVGQWQVLNIGLSKEFIDNETTPWHFLLDGDLKAGFRHRKKFDHKGKFGHALLIGGSYGKSGAAVLSSRAALLSGAGLLTVHVPGANYAIQQSSVPEAMTIVDENSDYISTVKDISAYNAIAVGPGLGKDPSTAGALKLLIQNSSRPLIFDADAINILAENLTWLSFMPAGSILTPHVGEFERLAGKCSSGWERLQKAREMALRFNCYIILKGAHTAIVAPDKQVIFNSTGNAGMATGGTGDVLTGILLGFLAQGYSGLYTCMISVFLHGLAAEIAARRIPLESMLAGDIASHLPMAMRKTFY